ncbi:MAG: NAD(P)H-hydrate dehydratase [Planctomycetota bacterium]
MRHLSDVPAPPVRSDEAHKGTHGKLLVVGGSATSLGAPMLAARAAYRVGCGYVRVALPREMMAAGLSTLPEAVGVDRDDLRAAIADSQAIVVGPGLGTDAEVDRLLDEVLAADLPTVLDADALNLLAARDAMPVLPRQAVLTPHPGEMARLTGANVPHDDAGRELLAAASTFGRVLVLKGPRTLVCDGTTLYRNTSGDSTLAKAGTGDVLAGVIGAFLAAGMPAFDAAVLGVHRHGLAGELVGRRLGRHGALASDIADAMADVLR